MVSLVGLQLFMGRVLQANNLLNVSHDILATKGMHSIPKLMSSPALEHKPTAKKDRVADP